MAREKVNLREKLGLFSDHFAPWVVATLNDYNVMLVKVRGEFVWHSHPETDDFFLVLDGQLAVDLRDRMVLLETGELFIVPAGVEHRPRQTRRRMSS
jgi:mannose-6-phosphate isomerase-like protein (cupin superfamily)